MKGPRLIIKQFFSLFTLILLLQACGGSGNNAPTFTISADTSKVTFSTEAGIASEQTLAVNVSFDGEGLLVGYSPDAASTGWLNYRTETVSATSAIIYIDVVTEFNSQAGPVFLPQGLYNSTLRLSTGSTADRNLAHHDIDVSLLVWQLMTFSETFGAATTDSQTVSVTHNGDTLSASSDVDWLTVQTQADTENTEFTVTADLSGFSASGLYQGNIIVTGTNGDMNFPVELGLDNRYLFADDNTLAFTSTPDIDATEQTITISSNSLSSYNWQASTQTPWLTLTPIADSNQLKVTANPLLASANTLNNASITISSPEDNTLLAETVSISLYNSDTSSESANISELAINENALVYAPLQPYIYVGMNNELRVYHLYSNELITSVEISPQDTLLKELVIHPQGGFMLGRADETTQDESGQSQTVIHRYKIDLSDITAISATALGEVSITSEAVKFVRFAGRYFVVTERVEIADENLQQLYWDTSDIFSATTIEQANQTGALFALDDSNATFKRYEAKVNDFTSNNISLSLRHSYRPESLADNDTIRDFIVTNDEANIYLLSPTTQWLSFDGSDFTDQGLIETEVEAPENTRQSTVALTKDNNEQAHFLIATFLGSNTFSLDAHIYDDQQTLVASMQARDNLTDLGAISADISNDNRRLIINNTSIAEVNTLSFTNLVQFTTSTTSLTFAGIVGESIPSQSVTISGIGENWQVAEDAGLIFTQDNSGELAQLTVEIDHTLFSVADTYTTSIRLSDPDTNTAAEIAVELILSEN
ncbi:hypothetical protein [Thalassomonas actiniarum]|uniref:BACON domain-containing protein n=1 Tax=Thalassomonas actiniarum TaxID=485447 RepID=A0AAE9YNV6_9GAMM|nr:hypothetical protein [Thalassomonas actiniarum]WDD98127.1 hypothetical protein SG35_023045 [Thalassomonas actiniarum]